MERVSTLKSPPIVGVNYLVPCVFDWGWWMPIVGDAHTDIELGIAEKHFHYDARFLTPFQLNMLTQRRKRMSAEVAVLGRIHLSENLAFVEKVKKCRREMPDFPLVIEERYLELHKKYDGKKVVCGRCPHRNFPIESLQPDANGFVICNGHGLKIDTRNNCVVSRFEK